MTCSFSTRAAGGGGDVGAQRQVEALLFWCSGNLPQHPGMMPMSVGWGGPSSSPAWQRVRTHAFAGRGSLQVESSGSTWGGGSPRKLKGRSPNNMDTKSSLMGHRALSLGYRAEWSRGDMGLSGVRTVGDAQKQSLLDT